MDDPFCWLGRFAEDDGHLRRRRCWPETMAGSAPLSSRTDRLCGAPAWGDDVRIGIETGAMTPWLVHELRNFGLEVVCLDVRHARAALEMRINKTDQNDAEGLAQIVRTGWRRFVHVKALERHRAPFSAQGRNSSASRPEPHPGRTRDLRASARRAAWIAIRSEGRSSAARPLRPLAHPDLANGQGCIGRSNPKPKREEDHDQSSRG